MPCSVTLSFLLVLVVLNDRPLPKIFLKAAYKHSQQRSCGISKIIIINCSPLNPNFQTPGNAVTMGKVSCYAPLLPTTKQQ